MYQTLLADLQDGIYTLTINRPDKLNALNKDVFNDLEIAASEIRRNTEIKSVIITGAGAKAFVAGADITEFGGLDQQAAMALAQRGQTIFRSLETCPKPILAAVNGFALGGGCELAMACHFRIASENAKFGQPEVKLGLIPGYGGTQRLPQLIGRGRALQLLMNAEMIDAQTACQYGLVNEVVPATDLLTRARAILTVINSKAPLAVAACIEAVDAHYNKAITDGFAVEVQAFGNAFETEDMKEGTSAFLEKRKAQFQGK